MNSPLRALRSLVTTYNTNQSATIYPELESLFLSRDLFLDKVKKFDKIMAAHPEFEPMAEYAFDLLMTYHLEENQHNEDYFDTKDWMDIEDKTLERGTELLNILLYLTEAKDSEVNAELEDFLNEFLLIEEDEFQDEYKIYEELIANVELIDEDVDLIIESAKRIDVKADLQDLFLPLLLFFKQPNRHLVKVDKLTLLEQSLYSTLIEFYNN